METDVSRYAYLSIGATPLAGPIGLKVGDYWQALISVNHKGKGELCRVSANLKIGTGYSISNWIEFNDQDDLEEKTYGPFPCRGQIVSFFGLTKGKRIDSNKYLQAFRNGVWTTIPDLNGDAEVYYVLEAEPGASTYSGLVAGYS